MTRPLVLIVDVSTQEETIREMNDEEYARYLEAVASASVETPTEPDSVV